MRRPGRSAAGLHRMGRGRPRRRRRRRPPRRGARGRRRVWCPPPSPAPFPVSTAACLFSLPPARQRGPSGSRPCPDRRRLSGPCQRAECAETVAVSAGASVFFLFPALLLPSRGCLLRLRNRVATLVFPFTAPPWHRCAHTHRLPVPCPPVAMHCLAQTVSQRLSTFATSLSHPAHRMPPPLVRSPHPHDNACMHFSVTSTGGSAQLVG